MDADETAIRNELPVLQARIAQYISNNIFNADEYGFFCRQQSNINVGPDRLPGRKKQKDRVTFLFCVNGYGNEEILALVIVSARNPGASAVFQDNICDLTTEALRKLG